MMNLFATILDAPSRKFWYHNYIGDSFPVINAAHGKVRVRTAFGDFWIEKRDCVVSDERGNVCGLLMTGRISQTHKIHPGQRVTVLKASERFFFVRWYDSTSGTQRFATIEKNDLLLDVYYAGLSGSEMAVLENGFSNPALVS